jgi:hypothetical protein
MNILGFNTRRMVGNMTRNLNEYVTQQIKEFFWKVTSKAKPPNHEFSLKFTGAMVYEANDIELN